MAVRAPSGARQNPAYRPTRPPPVPDLRKRRSGVSAVAHLSHAKSATLARRSGERELHGIPRAVDVAGHQVPVRVERLADRLVAEQPLHGLAASHLAQRFKELIGVTPKRLARTYRFAATVFAIDPTGPIDWGDLAVGAGYFDQAHVGHELRAFTRLTSTRYVETPAAVPARTSRPRAGRLAAGGRLISYKSEQFTTP